MNGVAVRLTLMLSLGFVMTALPAGAAAWFFSESQAHEEAIATSVHARELALKGDASALNELARLDLSPPRRATEARLLAASRSRAAELRERVRVFQANESEFQRYTRGQMTFAVAKIKYAAGVSAFAMLLSFIAAVVFTRVVILGRLSTLAFRMDEFLDERYTYRFEVPAADEIGQMQSTFNALAERVRTNVQELRTLDEAKSEFLSIASHELRTPLTSIKGSLGLMRSGVVGNVDSMTAGLVTIAETETDRLIRLINDILDLAKIEARKSPLERQWRGMTTLLDTTLASLEGLARQAEVSLTAEVQAPVESLIDADRVQQVLTNLLSNAIKFSPAGRTVTVALRLDEQQNLVIEVRDQGRGIAPEDREAIFQKFRQASNSRNPLVKGTGLGLAIARALVEEHGGEIGVRSTPGEGSVFYFTLPEWRYASATTSEVAA